VCGHAAYRNAQGGIYNCDVTLRNRLLLILALVGGLCTLTGVGLLRVSIDRHERQELGSVLQIRAHAATGMLDGQMRTAREACSATAAHPGVLACARSGACGDSAADTLQASAAVAGLDSLQVLTPGGQALVVTGDPTGAGLARGHDSTGTMLVRGMGSWWTTLDGVPTQLSVAPVTEDGQRWALVLAARELRSLQPLKEAAGADLALVGGDVVLVHTFGSAASDDVAAVLSASARTEPRRVGIEGERYGVLGADLDPGAGAYRPTLQVAVPWRPITGLDREVSGTLLVIGAVGIVLAAVMLLFTARALTAPLERLVAFARHAAEGDPQALGDHSELPEVAVLEDALEDWLRQQRHLLDQGEQGAREGRDREIDRWIQGSLTPEPPEVEAYDLAVGTWRHDTAGGDLVEMVETDTGALWIAVGDASARGLRAGMLCTLATGALRAAVGIAPASSPSRLLQALDDVLRRYIEAVVWPDSFLAIRLLRLAPDGILSFAGAHEEMVLLRADGTTAEALDWRGSFCGLGLGGEVDDPDGRVRLAPGDCLVLVTDGLLGAVDENGRLFGSRGVQRVVEDASGQPARVVRDRLMGTWTHWARRPDDDATVVVVRRRGAA